MKSRRHNGELTRQNTVQERETNSHRPREHIHIYTLPSHPIIYNSNSAVASSVRSVASPEASSKNHRRVHADELAAARMSLCASGRTTPRIVAEAGAPRRMSSTTWHGDRGLAALLARVRWDVVWLFQRRAVRLSFGGQHSVVPAVVLLTPPLLPFTSSVSKHASSYSLGPDSSPQTVHLRSASLESSQIWKCNTQMRTGLPTLSLSPSLIQTRTGSSGNAKVSNPAFLASLWEHVVSFFRRRKCAVCI